MASAKFLWNRMVLLTILHKTQWKKRDDPGREFTGLQLWDGEKPEILGFTRWKRQLALTNN